MAKNSIDTYGAEGKTNLLMFRPENLTLITDPNNPLYDERVHAPLDETMIQGIDDVGVLQAILVQKNPETGATEVIVGRQRVKNCAEANRRRQARGEEPRLVPAVARTYSRHKPDAAADLMVMENEHRTADSQTVRAMKMSRLRDLGRTDAQLAQIFRCTVETVRATLPLAGLTSAAAEALDTGLITMGHARKLAELEPDAQRVKVAELAAAAQNATPRERVHRQRAVLGDAKPAMRTRRQIEKELARFEGADAVKASVLRWVLGQVPGLD